MLEPKVYKGKTKSKSPGKKDAVESKKVIRKPQPPRQPSAAKRPSTAKMPHEERNPITQEKLNGKHNVPIAKPQIKPDPDLAEKKSAQKKSKKGASTRRSNRPGDQSMRSVHYSQQESNRQASQQPVREEAEQVVEVHDASTEDESQSPNEKG